MALDYTYLFTRDKAQPSSRVWQWLTARRLLTIIFFIGLFVMTIQPVSDPDLWWHLRTGQWILETHSVPMSDMFSSTAYGKRWIEHEWLSNTAAFLLYQAGGLNALILVTSGIIMLTFALVYRLSALRPHVAVFTTLLAALASAFAWDPRPQMLTMLFVALTLLLIRRARRGSPRTLYWMPLLMLFWVNLHSGFFLGLVILAVTLVGDLIERVARRWRPSDEPLLPIKPLALTITLSFVAALFNPNGLGMVLAPLSTLGNKTIGQFIIEWQSPDFHNPRFLPFALLLLGLLMALALSPRRPSASELLLVLGLGYESLVSARNIPFFAIVAAPLITRQAAALWSRRPPPQRALPRAMAALNWAVLCLVSLAASARVGAILSQTTQQVAESFPARSADYLLREKPAGPLLNSYNFGGYLIWRLYPTYPIFIDGRAEFIYDDAFISEFHARVHEASGDWQAYLDRHHINLVMIEKDSALAAALRQHTQWRLVQEDQVAAVFQRAP